MPRPVDVEERLRRHAQAYRRNVTPPIGLAQRILATAGGATPAPSTRPVLRDLAVAAAFILVAAAMALGFSRLHRSTVQQPAHPNSQQQSAVIPWISRPAPPPPLDLAIASITSRDQAAVRIQENVTAAKPLLLPQDIDPDWQAHLSLDAHGFTILYQDPTNMKLVWLSIGYGNSAAGPQAGPAAGGGIRTFRGVRAEYSYGTTQPTSPRYLQWNEPGTWDAQPGIGVPYYLTTIGLTDKQFWQIANSIGPIIMPPACRAVDLVPVFNGSVGAAGGHAISGVTLANTGLGPCTLAGYPTVILLNAGGGPVPTTEIHQDPTGLSLIESVVLEPRMRVPQSRQSLPGTAAFQFEWYGCPNPPALASQFRIVLPGGTLTVATGALGPVSSSNCNDRPTSNGLFVGPFTTTDQAASPEPSPSLTAQLTLPHQVAQGQSLRYTVTLVNTSFLPFTFGSCPGYFEILGPKEAEGSYQLNCSPVPTIAPQGTETVNAHDKATFAMVLDVPKDAPVGQQTLSWTLELPTGEVSATGTVMVVAP